jgi:hypothetical protein
MNYLRGISEVMTFGPFAPCFGVLHYQHTSPQDSVMTSLKTFFAPSPSAYPTTAPAPAQTTRRYRERDFGVGYGSSSGYASTRRYADSRGATMLRCK